MKRLQVFNLGTECQGVKLESDPRNPEPLQFSVQFPGGEVRVCRQENGDYWCHVTAFKPQHFDGSERDMGEFVDSRIDCLAKHACETIGGDFASPDCYHVAVRVSLT